MPPPPGALLGQPLKAVDAAIQRREILFMAILNARFRQITDYSASIKRVIGADIDPRDADLAERRALWSANVSLADLFDRATGLWKGMQPDEPST
jgi:hypothetical protein